MAPGCIRHNFAQMSLKRNLESKVAPRMRRLFIFEKEHFNTFNKAGSKHDDYTLVFSNK